MYRKLSKRRRVGEFIVSLSDVCRAFYLKFVHGVISIAEKLHSL